jgi:hypothetical protein
MTGRRRSSLLLAFVALAWLGSGDTDAAVQNEPTKPVGAVEALGAAGQVKDAAASPVYEQTVQLTQGVETTFETRELSAGSDPVLHLLTSAGIDFMRSDDADADGTRDARITVRPSRTGPYRLVLHAFKPESAGTARIYRDGAAISPTVAFAGWRALVAGIRDGESLETVRLPTSEVSRPVLYIFYPDQRRIWQRVTNGGTAGEPGFEFQFTAGSRHVILGTRDATSGTTRVVRNDSGVSGHDPDRDRLGSELETRLRTCTKRSGVAGSFDCGRTSDARDTDGDGIRDDWEVLGRRDRSPHQPLPLWGANPRHKDIFVEIDFMRRCGDAEGTDRVMTEDTARMMAAFYGDRVGPPGSPTRRAARALDLENPDVLPGVLLHLDTGLAAPAGETTFGDWGGHSVVPPARDGSGNCTGGQSAATAWGSMARVRRGVFHYVPAYFGGGGQATEWRAYAAFNGGSALNSAHEFGHSLGLGHSGRAGASFADPNCKPTYPSIMNYGYYDHWWETADVGFSDGRDRLSLINGSLTELGAINPNDAWFVNHLRTIFDYNVDTSTGNVDWNRNGMFESLTVSGYTNYAAGGAGCEWTKYNAVPVSGNSMKSPSVVRLGRYTYVFYSRARDGRLAYARTSSRLRCRQPVNGACDGASFGTEKMRAVDATRGVAAVRLRFGDTPTILVTAVSKVGRLRETRLSLPSGESEAWSSVRAVPGVSLDGEPALERVSASTAYLAFAGTDRQLRYRIFSTLGGWSPAGLATSPDANGGPPEPLPALPAAASPGLGWLYLPSQPRSRALYGAFADTAGRLALYRLDRLSGLWHATSDLDSRPVVLGRPAMLWAPTYTTDESIGRVYLHYVDSGGIVRWMTTWAQGIGAASVQRIGLDGPLQNSWLKGYGVGTMYEFGVDSNVRTVIAKQTRDDGKLSFYPNGDGITDFPIANHNDWRVFRTSLCRTLMHPTGGGADPLVPTVIRCEPAP